MQEYHDNAADIVDSLKSGDDIIPFMVEVKLVGPERDAFLKIRETLTRIGISSRVDKNVLFQTCHILQKRGKFYIVHFKTLFLLDGRENNLTMGDIARQNRVAALLEEWGMIEVMRPNMILNPQSSLGNMMIVPFAQKEAWSLKTKYKIGNKK